MGIRETIDIPFSLSVFNSGNTPGARVGGSIMHLNDNQRKMPAHSRKGNSDYGMIYVSK